MRTSTFKVHLDPHHDIGPTFTHLYVVLLQWQNIYIAALRLPSRFEGKVSALHMSASKN